ncbi:MAG: hypothetical protein O3A00_09570, partial [Planctomycetota bacterium]|nr:hypothetical protein [Planctomycetota bacterium]
MTIPTIRRTLATCSLIMVFAASAFAQPGGSRGPSRGSSGSSTDRFFGYLDRNRDGKLDGDEMRRLPGSMREAFEKSKIDVRNGISRDDFNRTAPSVFEDMRRRREEERGS